MTEQLALVDVRTGSGRRSRANTGMTEAQLLDAVRQLAHYRGWWTYHTADSRGSEAGWPDLVLVHRRHRRLIVAELKTAAGLLTEDQIAWLDALEACGLEATVWRPVDLAELIPAVLAGKLRAAIVRDPQAPNAVGRIRAQRPGEHTGTTQTGTTCRPTSAPGTTQTTTTRPPHPFPDTAGQDADAGPVLPHDTGREQR